MLFWAWKKSENTKERIVDRTRSLWRCPPWLSTLLTQWPGWVFWNMWDARAWCFGPPGLTPILPSSLAQLHACGHGGLAQHEGFVLPSSSACKLLPQRSTWYRCSSTWHGAMADKSIISWKYPKPKVYLIQLTYWVSELSLAYLKCAQNTISKNASGNTVHCRALVVDPPDCRADGDLWLPAAAQLHEGGLYCISQPGKEQNSKFEVWFLLNAGCFHTIVELKNFKLNHHKWGPSECAEV